jgi:hypothetical protein
MKYADIKLAPLCDLISAAQTVETLKGHTGDIKKLLLIEIEKLKMKIEQIEDDIH